MPWTGERFQLNSKHNTLPCEGAVTVGDRRYVMDPAECHAVQDFGRGIWPYRSFWNWGVATGVQDGVRIGVNVGAKWTTGTGVNENGLLIDGRLHKIMEDLRWDYDPSDWMRPWRVRAEHSGAVDLVLRAARRAPRRTTSLGVLSTRRRLLLRPLARHHPRRRPGAPGARPDRLGRGVQSPLVSRHGALAAQGLPA